MQADVLMKRFIEKGYVNDILKNTLEDIKVMDRGHLLRDKPPRKDQVSMVPFITTYSVQHTSTRNLIRKHWHILNNDPVLFTVLPDMPQVIYRGASSLKDRLAPNIMNPPAIRRGFFENLTGFISAGGVGFAH